MDFKYPVPGVSRSIGIAHSHIVIRTYQTYLSLLLPGVRKLAYKMPRYLTTKEPSSTVCFFMGRGKKLSACDIDFFMKPAFDGIKHCGEISAKRVLRWIRANYITTPNIGFPRSEHGTEIDKNDIVVADRAIGDGFRCSTQGVDACAHYPIMPMFSYAELADCKRKDVSLNFHFRATRQDKPRSLYGVQQRESLALCSLQCDQIFIVLSSHSTLLFDASHNLKHD